MVGIHIQGLRLVGGGVESIFDGDPGLWFSACSVTSTWLRLYGVLLDVHRAS